MKMKACMWVGRILTVLVAVPFLFSAYMKFSGSPQMAEGILHLGWENISMTKLGILEVTCLILFLVPWTATLGAVLLTGYIGGAIATHIRVGDGVGTQILIGLLIWLALYLRDSNVRATLPMRCCKK